MATLDIQGVRKSFGATKVLHGINLAVAGAVVMYDRMMSLGRFAPRPVHSGAPDAPAPAHVHGPFKRFRREPADREDAFTAERE